MMRVRLVSLLLLLAALLPGVSAASSDSRFDAYDAIHYDISLNFNVIQKTFTGTVGVSARILSPTRTLLLNASSETLVIDSVSSLNDHQLLSYEHENDLLEIDLGREFHDSDECLISVHYHGISTYHGQYDKGGVYMTITKGRPHLVTSSQPWYARTWWPCKDYPNDKAMLTMTVTVPASLTAVSNGVLKSQETDGITSTYVWETRYPIATYLVAVAAARYRQITDTYVGRDSTRMKITHYVFPEDYSKAQEDFKYAKSMLKFLAGKFGEYPFIEEKFSFAEVEGSITMENQTLCTIQDQLLTGNQMYSLVLFHEIAHQWWGNLITPATWNHTWLNEGFATYAEALYLENRDGPEGYKRYMNAIMGQPVGYYAGSVIGQSDTTFWDSFADRVYKKGAIILHMLRGMVGDSIFFQIMQDYLNDTSFRYGNATSADFIGVCERVAQKDFRWFFDQWLYAVTDSIDRPQLEYDWNSQKLGDTYAVNLTLVQKEPNKVLYRLPLTVSIATTSGKMKFPLDFSRRFQIYTFPTPSAPLSIEIDRDGWIFKVLKQVSK